MTDQDILEVLGDKKIAELLGVSPKAVNNWKRRGVPAEIKVRAPWLFLNPDEKLINYLASVSVSTESKDAPAADK